MVTQTLGGVGMASAIAVSALIAAEVSGSDSLSGLANTTQVLGAALITVPVAAAMARYGRRIGLSLAYLIGIAGAALVVTATVLASFAVLLLGTFLIGAATTAANQSRYAGVDLAPEHRRGLHLSLVIWASTVGAVLGPNLVGPASRWAEQLGLPPLSGPFLFAGIGFALAATLLTIVLRPDPLLTARRLENLRQRELAALSAPGDSASSEPGPMAAPVAMRGSMRRGMSVLISHLGAREGVVALAAGHAVMVAVMVMTPVHMRHGHAEVEVIGFVISIHILGMYGLSPLFGSLVDRAGAVFVVRVGSLTLIAATVLAGISPHGSSLTLTLGLLLLGIGWSATMVAGSNLVATVQGADRPATQGAADLTMGLVGAAAGALAGVVVGGLGYGWLCLGAGLVALALGVFTLRARPLVSLGR